MSKQWPQMNGTLEVISNVSIKASCDWIQTNTHRIKYSFQNDDCGKLSQDKLSIFHCTVWNVPPTMKLYHHQQLVLSVRYNIRPTNTRPNHMECIIKYHV
eukprot:515504_1